MKKSMKGFMFYVAFVASLGGLLFGFDTAVISGAEKAIREVYALSDWMLGFTIAIALIGTIIGTLVCTKPVEKYGRLDCLKVIAILYLISAIGCAAIVDWYSLLFFRFLGGIAVGASSVVGPMYIAEISPSNWRGRFVAFFQFNIVLGIVLAYLSNYLISGIPNDWQWMLGALAVPAIFFAVLLFTIPESPRWLIKMNRSKEAETVFEKIGEPNIKQEVTDIKESLSSVIENEPLFLKKYRKPIMIAFLIATFNQLAGINAILYYAPRIFETAGVFRDSAMMQSVIIGLTNLLFTMIGMSIIDKLGRKKLLYIGSVGMVIALALVTRAFYLQDFGGYWMLVYLMGFIASFAISLGATIWVLISEVFPTSVRAKGQVLGSLTHWAWCAIISWIFPVIISIGGQYIFAVFTIAMIFNFIFALKLPDTKGKSLEAIQKELVG